LRPLQSIGLVLLAVFISPSVFGECLGDKSAKNTRSVYIVPQLTVSQTFTLWAPLLEQLGIQSKQCFELVVPATIPLFEKEILSGKPDFAFVNPYHAVMAFNARKYIPLIADGKNKLSGIILIRADSKISNLKDLNGSTIAFPAPNSFAASLLTRSYLTQSGVAFTARYVNTHQNVYRSIIAGDVQAGGGVNNTFNRESDEIKSQLKILYETPSFMPHPFVANPRIPLGEQNDVKNAFLLMKSNPSTAGLLNKVQIPDPIEVNYKKDYLPLTKLKLEKFIVSSEN
jgi:phosphonate transport system substrate-binding protein